MEFKVSTSLVEYEEALRFMDERVAGIRDGSADECMWLLEHPSLYTAGTSAKVDDLLEARFPVHQSGRGGEYTYHGPGQRVGYVMLDLKARQAVPDIKKYVWQLEEWVIQSLAAFDIAGERREGRVGIWVNMERYGGAMGEEAKIAALGVRVRHWITLHGVSVNIAPDLSHFGGIVPCGIAEHGVVSVEKLIEERVDMDRVLQERFGGVFG